MVVLEGNFKLKKVFCLKHQIPIQKDRDESLQVNNSKKTEPIPNKLDFLSDVDSVN